MADSEIYPDPDHGTDLAALQQVARIVSRGDDAESRIQDILRHLAGAPGLVRGRVLLADLRAGELYIRYAHGLTPEELERGRLRIGEGVSGRVFQTGEPALIADLLDEPPAATAPSDAPPAGPLHFLAVPIVRDHLPVGVLAVQRRDGHVPTARRDLVLLEVVASLISQILRTTTEAQPWVPPVWHEPWSAAPRSRPPPGDQVGAERDLRLRMAEQWHAEGRLHLATDLYLKVAGAHPGTEEALLAKSKLLEIARYYEDRGTTRMAADVLARLQRALEQGGPGDGEAARRPDAGGDGERTPTEWDSFGDSAGSGGLGVRIR